MGLAPLIYSDELAASKCTCNYDATAHFYLLRLFRTKKRPISFQWVSAAKALETSRRITGTEIH